MTPARIAVSNTGPFLVRWPVRCSARATSAGRRTRASASATRWVTGLAPTSTMVGRARASRCVRRAMMGSSAPDVIHFDMLHAASAQLVAQLAVAVGAPLPYGADQSAEFCIGGAPAQRRAQVRPIGGEQTGIELAVRGQPRARAVAAKRLRHGGHEPNLPGAVAEGVAARDFTGVGWLERLQRPARSDALEQSLRGHHA